MAEKLKPDWIIGFSDTYYGILAVHLAGRLGCKSLIDAYDNYESYIPWFRPLQLLWRNALARADLITAAGPQLAELMNRGRKDKPSVVVPMAADPIFKPLDKKICRKNLGLPLDRKLIGYCGSIHPSRDINILFDAFRCLAAKRTDIELVLTGRKAPKIEIPKGINWLGYLPDEKMPLLLNSMDVLTVLNQDSSFGNFSYPVKLYEAMSCKVPVVATATPATKWIMKKHLDHLVPPGDSISLCKVISGILEHSGGINYGMVEGWKEVTTNFEKALIV